MIFGDQSDGYIIIPMGKVKLSSDDESLRVMDQDMGPDVYAIWSDSEKSIAALVFDKGRWSESEAQEYIAKAKDEGKKAQDVDAADDSPIDLSESPLYGFWGSLGDGSEAEEAGDGLYWKEILHPGKWFKTNSGKSIEVTSHIIQEAYRAFTDGYPRYISVPSDHHWIGNRGVVPPEHNRGFVKKLKLMGDKLYAGFSFASKDTEAGVLDGSIADVSAYLQPNVTHNATGNHYDWALRHVLLTNNPLVSDLSEWGVIAADDTDIGSSGRRILNYIQVFDDEEETMVERAGTIDDVAEEETISLSGEAAVEYAYLQDRGYTTAALMALSDQAASLESMGLSIDDLLSQAVRLRETARSLEIDRVIAAMEGTGEHAGVVAVEGRRHYPVVVEAVTAALTHGASDMALTADESGVTPVDSLILGIINAIPGDARLSTEVDEKGARRDGDGRLDLEAGDESELSDEMVDAFLEDIS